MNANQFLRDAGDTLGDRATTYDAPGGERSAPVAAQVWNLITGKNMTAAEAWLFLQILKDVRQWQRKGYHHDSALDCVAYAALKAEALSEPHQVDMFDDAN